MRIIKQISSLEKVRSESDMRYDEIKRKTLLRGERFSYQIAAKDDRYFGITTEIVGKIEVESVLSPYIKVFYVDNAVMDCPLDDVNAAFESDFIDKEPGLMPDILVPIEEQGNMWIVRWTARSLWVELNVPEDIEPGIYDINIKLHKMDMDGMEMEDTYVFTKTMTVEIIDAKIVPQSLIYTRWLYVDCIADYHGVDVYSEKHWALIEKYITQAVECGINMILVPVHTPPLDTAIGHTRTCVQLVDIKKEGDVYHFSFDRFHRFVEICKKCGVKYFEIAHMFSQWGAKCAPNIMVEENGKTDYLFGWHVAADSDIYIDFLKQYIGAISKALVAEGIDKNTYFHISDEPSLENMETYKRASEIIRPLIGESKTFDALSSYEFYEKGLVECPVTGIAHIHEFLDKKIENQWLYYCCSAQSVFCNSIMSMPSSRVRVLGLLMYKYDIKGFLHWGLNFYNGRISKFRLDPYVTTSAYGAFPSGDPFVLYPSKDGAYSSIRAKIIYEAIEDMKICHTLEKYIGRQAVIEMIDSYAGAPLAFDVYPKGNDYLERLRNIMTDMIKDKA